MRFYTKINVEHTWVNGVNPCKRVLNTKPFTPSMLLSADTLNSMTMDEFMAWIAVQEAVNHVLQHKLYK